METEQIFPIDFGPEINVSDKKKVPTEYGLGVRHAQAIIFFLCVTTAFTAWSHITLTIVSMHRNHDSNAYFLRNDNQYSTHSNGSFEKIFRSFKSDPWDLSKTMQLFNYFSFIDALAFPMGLVGQRWGGKVLMQLILAVCAIVSLASPWITLLGWGAFFIAQFLQKVFLAGLFPAMYRFLSCWAAASERAQMTTFLYAGTIFGLIVGNEISNLTNPTLGWPATFWITGMNCLIMFILLSIFGVTSPEDCKSMPKEEKYFILGDIRTTSVKHYSVPWAKIFTSKLFYLCVITQSFSTSLSILMSQFPLYLRYTLDIDYETIRYFSYTYMHCIGFIVCILFGVLSDFFTKKKILKTKSVRIISNSFGIMVPAIFLCSLTFIPDRFVIIPLYMVTYGCWFAIFSGWAVSYVDLSPKYCGILIAFGQSITVLISNAIIHLFFYVTINENRMPLLDTEIDSITRWQIMYCAICGLAIVVNTLYVKFISTDMQPFNGHEYEKELENMQKRSAVRMKI